MLTDRRLRPQSRPGIVQNWQLVWGSNTVHARKEEKEGLELGYVSCCVSKCHGAVITISAPVCSESRWLKRVKKQ